ncbi:MAG: tetratricopeptide repeat protein [Promethearchaeota archaeon]
MKSHWSWSSAPSHINLETLFRPQHKFSFLAGSGISLDPPSCLPSGYHFTKALLETLIPSEEHSNVLKLMDPERPGMRDPGDFLRFEQLMEYLQRWYDPELRVLDGYATCKTPNLNHQFLAQMLTRGHTIFTTNFDSLIEYAFLEAQVLKQEVFPVIHRQDWELAEKKENYPVYKLHGSLIDVRNNQDSRTSLQATLSQIAQEKSDVFQLEPWKQKILHTSLQANDVVVLGYSGLDDFDVFPTLWTIPSPKRILWIVHDSNRSLSQAKIEIIQVKDSSPSSKLDRVARNLLAFAQYQTRKANQLFRITVNTRELLKWLWERYIGQTPTISSTPCPKEELAIPTHLRLSEERQWFLTGQIYMDRNLPSQSLKVYQTALKAAQATGNTRIQAACLNDLGMLVKAQGQMEEALDYYQQALTLDEEQDNLQGKSIRLTNIGQILYERGRVKEALDYHQQALAIDEQLGNLRGKADGMNNIGLIFYNQGQVKEALDYFQRSLTIVEQLGDLKGKSNRLNNIGQLLLIQGQVKEALNYYQEALRIDEQIGDLRSKATHLNNIGQLFYGKGQLSEALKYYQQALTIDEQLGDLDGKAIRLNNMGQLFYSEKRFDEALEYYQQSLNIVDQTGSLAKKAIRLNNIASVFVSQERFDKALDYFRQALQINEQLGDPRAKATDLNNIGIVYHKQKRLDEALDYYQRALIIAEQLGDIRAKATRLNNIGHIYKGKGEAEKALDFFQQALAISEEIGDKRGQIIRLRSIGNVLKDQGKSEEASKYYDQALNIAKQLKAADLVKSVQDAIEQMRA